MNTNTYIWIHNPEFLQCFQNNQNRMVYFQSTGLLESGSTCMRAVTSKLCSDPEGEFCQIKYQDMSLRTEFVLRVHPDQEERYPILCCGSETH
jgi:hypothetical protein